MVDCFLIQVITGKEEIFIKHADRSAAVSGHPCKLILPRRELTIRKQGKHKRSVKPVFPGYVFWETEEVDPDARQMLRHTPGFIRFIKDEHGKLVPLTQDDRRIISSITSDGEIARRSLVYFDKNNRVRVLKGPLKGEEGSIIKVDRRKKRVTVQLVLHDKRFKIAFEYEEVEKKDTESK
jgi:transcriptional antiterminator NusG